MSSGKAHIVVVGAGLAGLGAAWRLAREGFGVTVLEASGVVGGRVAGEWVDGFSVERGIGVMTSADRNLLALIEEVGLGDQLLPPRPVELAQACGSRVTPILPESLLGLASIPGVSWWDRKRLLRLPRLMNRYLPDLDRDRPERAAGLDFRSAADFARLYLGQSLFERWISPAVASAHVADEHELSRVAFLLDWVASRQGNASLGIPRRGLQELPRSVAQKLDVRRGAEVDRIEALAAERQRVRFRVDGAHESIDADAVVVATAPDTAMRIADPVLGIAERDFFAQVRFGPLVSMTVAVEHPLSAGSRLVRVPHAEASPIECYLVEAGSPGGRAPTGTGLVTLVATQRFALANAGATDEVVEKALLGALGRFHPSVARSLRLVRLQRADAVVPLFYVGAYRALERFQRVQADCRQRGRRLYFAGDYLAGPSAESALGTGFRAAATALHDLP